MNKIYKVIWSKIRNCYVVVSEIAKRNSKGSAVTDRRRRFSSVLAAMVLASLLNLGVAAPVWADPPVTGADYYGVNATNTASTNKNGEGAVGAHAIAAGENAQANGEKAISIGYGANGSGITAISVLPKNIPNELIRNIRKFDENGIPTGQYYSSNDTEWTNLDENGKKAALLKELNYRLKEGGSASIAIGDTTFSLKGDVVIGSTAKALGNDAVVLGRGTTGFDNSVAVGTLAVAAPNSIAIGAVNHDSTQLAAQATANYSIAIGNMASATETNALALGIGASATAGQATAVGKGASASGTNSIALGNDSKGNTSSSIAIGNQANNSTNGFGDILLPNANIPTGGKVHVFKNKNNNNNYEVVTDDSGNPVYYDTKAIINEVEITYKWADLTDNEKKNVFKKELTLKMQDRDADPGLATYRQSITIGEASNALKEFDVVIGSTAVAAGSGTIAIGRVAKGLGNNNVAIGTSALTGSANAIAIGNASQTFGANGVAIGPSSQTSGSNALSVGYGAKAQQSSAVALGHQVTASGSKSISIGNQGDNKLYTNAKGSQSIAIGSGAQALNNYAVALGESTKAYSKGSATVGYHSYAFGEDSTVFGHDSTAHGKASSVFGYLSTAGAVTLLSGDGNENYLSSWSRTRVVKEVYEDGGTTVDHYERQGNLSATDETHRNKYEIVTTKNGQVLALDREAAEQGTTQYFKVKEFRKIPWEGNALDPRDNEQSKGDVYWFVVDTSNSGKVNINNYGGQTEGGVAFGDYANAVGDKALAVGRSTIADGNDSAAIGMFANAYGTGSMAYGQNTSTGVQVETVYTNGNDNRHNTVLKTEEDGSVYRRTVSGGTALMNKLNQYIVEDLPTTDSGTITVKLNLDGSIAAYLKDGAPDKGTQAYVDYLLDPDNWNSGGNAKINNFSSLSESDQVSFKVGNKTVKTTAGNLMLTQGGVAFGSYAHAEGNNAMSIGRLAGAYDTNTMAIGLNANAWGRGGVAIGHNTFAGTDDFQVVADDYGGHTAVLKSNPNTGIVTAEANGAIRSVAIGSFSTASGSRSVAIGRETSAYGEFSLATGVYANAVGDRSTVYGNNAIAGSSAKVVDSGDGTYEVEPNALDTDGKPIKYALVKQEDGNEKKVAVIKASDGKYYEATLNENGRYYLPDDHSSASVYDSSQLIKNGMAVGAYTHAESSHAIAMGIASGAHDRNGMAIGLNANAWGRGGIAIGHNTITGTDDFKIVVDELGAHTAILNTDSNGEVISKPNDNRRAVAIGSFSVATGARAVAMGRETAAYGDDSLAVGVYANALGTESTVFGNYAMAGTQATVKASGDSYVIEPAALDTDGKPMQFARVEIDGETRKIPVIKGTDGNYYEAEKGADGRYYLPANPGSPYDSSQLVQNGMAVGPYTHAEDTHAIAMGVATGAYDKNSTAVGLNASAWGEGSMAYGHNAFAGTDGVEVKHDGNVYTAELVKDSTTDIVTAAGKEGVIGAIAFGSYAHASGDRALAIGRAAGAYGDISTAMGLYSNAYGEGALAVGHNTVTGAAVLIERDGDSDHHKATLVRKENKNGGDLVLRDKDGNAVVKDTDGKYYTAQLVDRAYQKTETTVDAKNLAEGGIAMGSYSHAGGDRAIAIGRAAGADSKNSTAIGLYANAYGEGAMAIGHNTVAGAEVRTDNGHQIMALYDSDAADEPTSLGTGRRNKVNGTEVTGGIAIGSYAHALGDKAISVGRDSGAWGNNSSVFGLDSNAYGEGSIALGHGVTAGDSTNRYALFEVSQENAAAGNFDLDKSGYSSNPVGAVAVGSYAKATGRGSLAIGRNTETDSAYTTALGVRAKVMENAENAIAIGRETRVGDVENASTNSIAMGKGSTVVGISSIAIGTGHVVKGDANTVIGDPDYVDGNNNFVLANNVGTSENPLTVSNAVILGHHDTGNTHTFGSSSTSLGANAQAQQPGSVALGSDSSATTDKGIIGYDPSTNAASTKTDVTWKSTAAAVSVGGNGVTRQITNVAAGYEETDAVNVAQLKAARVELKKGTNTTLTTNYDTTDGHTIYTVDVDGSALTHFYSVNSTDTTAGNYNNDGATGTNALAAGVNAKAKGENSIAIGNGATADGKGAIVLGSGGAQATGDGAMSWGSGSQAKGLNSTAWGTGAIASGTRATAWGGPLGVSGGVNQYTTASGGDATAWGIGTTASGEGATSWGTGTIASGQRSTAWGTTNTASAYNATAFGNSTTATKNNATAWGKQTQATAVQATAFGDFTTASGWASTAWGLSQGNEGVRIIASNYASTAWGYASTRSIISDGVASTAFGYETQATGQMSTAWGQRTQATGAQATAFGVGSVASGRNATAFGASSIAGGIDATALGTQSQAFGENSLAALGGKTGDGTVTQNASTYVITVTPTKDAKGAVAIGDGAHAQESYTYAIGQNAVTSAADTIAFGNKASASVEGGVALGSESVANTDKEVAGFDPLTGKASTETDATWKSTAAAVSVGESVTSTDDEGNTTVQSIKTRQITNVAAGYQDTDAVNVAQLKKAGTHYYSVNSADQAEGSNYLNDGATGVDAVAAGVGVIASGDSAAAFGDHAEAKALRSIAIGNSAGAENDYGIAIGGLAKAKADGGIALGTSAEVTGANATAIGNSSKAEGATSVALGQAADSKGESAISIGTSSEAVTTGVAAGHMAKATGESGIAVGTTAEAVKTAIALGHGANATGESGISIGTNSSATTTAIALGHGAGTAGESAIAIGTNSNAATTGVALGHGSSSIAGGVALGVNSTATVGSGVAGYDPVTHDKSTSESPTWKSTAASVSVGGNGQTRQITNVAAGYADTDAVNVAQLKKVADGALKFGGDNTTPDTNIISRGLGQQLDVVGGANQNDLTDDNIGVISNGIDTLTVKLSNKIKLEEDGYLSVGEAAEGATIVNQKGLRVIPASGDIAEFTSERISAGNRKIENIAAGTADTDAVNVGQLKKARTTITAGTNVTNVNEVAPTDVDGNYTYKIDVDNLKYTANGSSTDVQSVALKDGLDFTNGTNTAAEVAANGVVKINAYKSIVQAKDGETNVTVDPTVSSDGFTTTYDVSVKDMHVNRGTASYAANGDGTATLTHKDGTTAEITGLKDTYVVSGKLENNKITLTRNDTNTVEIDGVASTDDLTHYYSVKSTDKDTNSNYDNKGATGTDAIAAGVGAAASGTSAAAFGDHAEAKALRTIAIGNSAGAENEYGIAIGGLAKAKAYGGIALGTSAEVTGANATAIGNSSKAQAATSVALGQGANATGESGIAVGTTAEAHTTAVAMGHMAKAKEESAIALGTNASAAKTGISIGHGSAATGESGVAIGTNSSAATTGVALGHGSSAIGGGVALGVNSKATVGNGVTGYDPATQATSTKSDATWKSTLAAVSVGGDGQTRQITNVAAGAELTDAVNVAQLKAARTELQDGTNTTVTKTQDETDGHTIYKVNAYKSVVQAKAGDTNITVEPTTDGMTTTYDISVKDMHVKDGEANYGTDGKAAEGTITLTHQDGTTAEITGLKNTYTTVTKDATAKTVTFSRNDGETQTVSLSDLGGSSTDYALDAQVVSVASDGTVTLAGKDRMNTSDTYNVKITGVATKDDVAKKIKFADTTGNYFEAGLGEQVNVVGEKGVSVASNNSNNTYTIGINGADAAKEIPLSYKANGSNGQTVTLDKGLDFTNGTNTTAEVAADGVVKINVSDTAIQTAAAKTDKYVRSGEVTYGNVTGGTAADGTATLTVADDSGNTTTATINGLKNTYTTGVTYDATNKKATFNRNDGNSYDLSLKDMGATDYRLVGDGANLDQAYKVKDDGTLTLNVKDQINGTIETVTIQDLVTKGDVAKKIIFKDGSDHSFEAGLGDEVTVKGINGIVTDAQDTNTYTIGINGTDAAKEIPLSYKANGTNGQTVTLDKGLDFTNGTNTTAEVAADGVVKINVSDTAIQTAAAKTDKYVRSGVATYGTDGKAAEGTATLTVADDSGNTSEATITGLKNTYTTVTKDTTAKTVTFSRNDGEIQTVSLNDLGGSSTDYRLVKNASSTDGSYKMADNGTVTMVVQDQMNPENTEQVTISGLMTKADVAASKTEVKAGTNVTVATDTTTAEDGHTIYTVNADGASVSKGSDAVTVTAGAKDTETNITDYKVDLSDATKATLNKVETTGLTFAGDTGTSNAIKLGDTLNVTGGATGTLTEGNIGVEADGTALKVKLADNINLTKAGSVTIGSATDGGQTVLDQNGLTVYPSTSSTEDTVVKFTRNGISAGKQQIENVADGEADTDAVNVRQLTKAAAAAKTKVEGGTNIASVDPSTGADGQTIYTVNADGASVSKGSDAVTVTAGAKDTKTNITDYKVDLSDATKATLNKAENAGLTFAGDTGTSNAIKLGDTLNVTGGATGALSDNNIGVEAEGNALKIKLAKDIEDVDSIQVNKSVTVGDGITIDGESTKLTVGDNITVDGENTKLTVGGTAIEDKKITMGDTLLDDTGMTVTGGPVLTRTSADMNGLQIKNVKAGEADTDAVNVRQLTKAAAAAKTEVAGGTNIASVDSTTGDDGQTIYTVNADGAKVSAGSAAVSVTKADEKDSKNIYDYSVDLSDATKATLNKVETRGLTFKGDSGSSEEIKLGDTLNVTGGATGTLTEGNIGVEAEGNALKVKLADNINLTKAGSVTIGTAAEGATVISQKGIRIIPATGDDITEFTTENISAGGQQIHKVKAGTADDDAVNVRQLNEAKEEAIGSVKLKFRGDNGDEVVRGNNETLQVVGDGSNITTESEDNKIKVELSKDLKVDSVTAGNTVINNDGVTADKVTVGDTVIEDGKVSVGDTTIEENKIAMGDTLITNDSVTTKSVTADEVTAGDTTINNDGVTTNKVTVGDTTINNDGVTTNKVTVGDTTINNDGLTIDGGPSVTKDGIDAGGKKITNVAAGVAGTDAVNVDQLKEATTGLRTEVKGGTNIASVEHTTGEKGQSIYTVNADGASVSAGSEAVTVTAGTKDANNVTDYKVDLSETAKASLDKVEKDGLTFKGDSGTSNKIKLGDTLNVTGGATGALSDGNIGVEGSGDALKIKLAKDVKDVDSIQINKTAKVGDNITIDGENTKLTVGNTTIEDNKMTMGDTVITNDGVTANKFTAGDTTLNSDGLAIADGPSVTKNGLNAGGQKVTGVAPGEEDTDAANIGQLRELADNAGAAINNVGNEVNRLDGRMKKGLAGAAALAALHPMDFDPDDKLTFAAGVGNYRGQNAAAIGAFYRPDEKIMFSVGGTVGNGENMVNAGVSFALDRVNRVTTSRTAMAHEIVELKKHIAHQDSQIAQLTQLVNKLVGPEQQIQNTAMFPDVPENHWAYAYLEDLQQRGIVEGYPGGRFIGDRAMTRYEFAAMLDRALQKGVQLDARLTKEFEPELGRIYVERIHGQDNDRHKIERVRVNNTDTRTRDVYGTKIS